MITMTFGFGAIIGAIAVGTLLGIYIGDTSGKFSITLAMRKAWRNISGDVDAG